MTRELQKIAEKSAPNKVAIYNEFVLWTALPHPEKERLGLETQNQFADYYHIDITTLSRWKQRPDFEERLGAILKMWATDKTPDVVHSIYRSAIKGNPMSQLLWLQYFKGFNPRKDSETEKRPEVTVNDIRHLINLLPEPLKQKHYGYLFELFEDTATVRNAGGIDDRDWYGRPEETIFDEAERTPKKHVCTCTIAGDYYRNTCEQDMGSAAGAVNSGVAGMW